MKSAGRSFPSATSFHESGVETGAPGRARTVYGAAVFRPTEVHGVTFDDGSRLDFAAEAERVATEDRRLVRIAYRQPFGTFTGALAGGLRLERGLGVMEHQDALW